MSLDLYLTSTGDITFEETKAIKENGLTFNFFIAPSNSLSFNFYTKSTREVQQQPQTLCMDFYTYTVEYNKNSRIIENNKFMQQAIKLRLSTEYGTITRDESYGSRIYELMHSNLDDTRLLYEIELLAKQALEDILPNATISAKKVNSKYLDYYDTVKLTIKHENKVYFYTL